MTSMTGEILSSCPFRVKLGSGEPFAESPLYPDERTSSDRANWSVSCHHRKSVDFSITSSVHSFLHFGLDGRLQKRSRAVAQDLGQRIPQKNSFGLEDLSVGLERITPSVEKWDIEHRHHETGRFGAWAVDLPVDHQSA
jgi:hypothetical protein